MVIRTVLQAFPDVTRIEQVVHNPHRVKAQLFGQGTHVQDRLRVIHAPVVGYGDTEFHRSLRLWSAAVPSTIGSCQGLRLFNFVPAGPAEGWPL